MSLPSEVRCVPPPHKEHTSQLFPVPELSDREREVLELLARGMPNSQIARKLVVSPETVRNHVSNIFTKLQVNDRAEAIKRAQAAGLGG
jgi:DNA-binding NarL/FixJ family response regulator